MSGIDSAEVRFWNVSARSGQVTQESIIGTRYIGNDATRRLLALLANTGLAERTARGEPMYVDLRRTDLVRVARLLAP